MVFSRKVGETLKEILKIIVSTIATGVSSHFGV
jgi:hypothetical protein